MGIRIMVKGGVWKNTEDEILKAAVMKYGLNQWPRVASLLNRKSAAQCKARWYEWLDPSIKKTEWTREEEEKLLHLAKILPSQWRTIAPLVGRTAAQCLEHYERLLDTAQQQAGEVDEEKRGEARKLRPGEIDPHPETKPARPDPIDMDEDEKEMLSEARARLANTRGKKAKRKAREKMLNEAKRLASLQKRRELKAAGMEFKMREKKRKYIDYAREIPFYRPAPAGFFDTSEEKELAKKQALDPTFEALRVDKLEEKRRDEEEARERARDKKRQKKIMEDNLPQIVMAVNERNDPVAIRRRAPLSLPAPQVTEMELEELVKGGAQPMLTDGSEATSALLGDYRDRPTPLATPMRTPKTAAAQDIVMQEARNLLALSKMETPLKGGENPIMEEGTGFDSHVPRSSKVQTPNVLASSKREAGGLGGATPGSATPLSIRSGSTLRSSHPGNATPMRDQLGLNRPGVDEHELMVLNERKRMKQQKALLLTGLEGLPAPQYMYDIEVPAEEEEPEQAAPEVEEDAADRDARLAAIRRAQEEAELARRSTAIKRDLPRPATVNPDPIRLVISSAKETGDEVAVADALIQQELLRILQHDAVRYPVKATKEGKKKKGSSSNLDKVDLPIIKPEDLSNAAALIEEEMKRSGVQLPDLEEFEETWAKSYGDMAYFPERQAWGRVSAASKQDRLAATKQQFEALAQGLEKDAKKVGKVEARVTIKTQGYAERSKKMLGAIEEALDETDTMRLEVACFQRLYGLEQQAVVKRLAKLEQEVKSVEDREAVLQETYANLCDEKDQLVEKLQSSSGSNGNEGAAPMET